MKHPRLEYALVSLFLLTALSARYYPVYTHWLVVGGAMAAAIWQGRTEDEPPGGGGWPHSPWTAVSSAS